jgi:hypothetical protein
LSVRPAETNPVSPDVSRESDRTSKAFGWKREGIDPEERVDFIWGIYPLFRYRSGLYILAGMACRSCLPLTDSVSYPLFRRSHRLGGNVCSSVLRLPTLQAQPWTSYWSFVRPSFGYPLFRRSHGLGPGRSYVRRCGYPLFRCGHGLGCADRVANMFREF